MTNNDTSLSENLYLNKLSNKQVIKRTREQKYKLYTFIILIFLQIFINYDNGVVPVSLNWIQEPYNFSSTELGIMGSLAYFAYVAMSPFMPYLFLTFSSQIVITVGLIINLFSLAVYGLSVNKYMFFVSKICIGASQALFTTYYPIWVDTFAPEFHRNLWMSILQGGIVTGMTSGYVVTSLFSFTGNRGWRYSMLTQVVCELILVVLFYLVPKEFVNFDPSRDEHVDFNLCSCEKSCSDTMEINTDKGICLTSSFDGLSNGQDSVHKRYRSLDFVSNVSFGMNRNQQISRLHSSFEGFSSKPEYSKCSKCFINNVKLYQETMTVKKLSTWSKFKLLIKHNIFILSCIGMSSVTFSASGMNFWLTKICLDYIKMNNKGVYLIFSVQPITGVLFGIISGSHLIDQIIYHYPELPLFVDFTLIVWSIIICIFDIVVIVIQVPIVYGFCVFIILFFGSAIVPTLTLQSVAYLPHRLKPAGATFFICQYHILGFTLGTIMPGIAIDIFNSYTAALCVIFLPGFVLLACCIAIMCIKWNRINKARQTGRSIYIKGLVVI